MPDPFTSLALATVVLAVLWIFLGALTSAVYPAAKAWLPPGPEQRSVVLFFVCVAPLLISLALTVMVFTPSIDGRLVEAHCHPDLECASHAPAIVNSVVAWCFVVLAVLLGGCALFHLCRGALRGRRLHRNLRVLAPAARGNFRLIASNEALAFSAGLIRPTVFVSQGLVQHTSGAELEAVVQHEYAHGRRRDNLRNWLAALGTSMFPVLAGKKLLQDLRMAEEQCCDLAAARALRDPLLVAHALVKVQKLARRSVHAGRCDFVGSNIEARVNALLHPTREPVRPGVLPILLFAGSVGLVVLATDPLHHFVERMLAWLQSLA